MSTYTVTISSPNTEKDFAAFLSSHSDIGAKPKDAIEYDPTIYDAEGNFQWISLAGPGLPVPDEYMTWRIEQSRNSPSISKEEFLSRLEQRRKEFYTK